MIDLKRMYLLTNFHAHMHCGSWEPSGHFSYYSKFLFSLVQSTQVRIKISSLKNISSGSFLEKSLFCENVLHTRHNVAYATLRCRICNTMLHMRHRVAYATPLCRIRNIMLHMRHKSVAHTHICKYMYYLGNEYTDSWRKSKPFHSLNEVNAQMNQFLVILWYFDLSSASVLGFY